jgi:predicted anti-sigma-YlaC factor YlaD
MLTCRQFREALCDYLDGTVESVARSGLDRHRSECTNCRIVWATTRKTIELYKSLPLHGVPPEVEVRLMAAIEMCRARKEGGRHSTGFSSM